MSEYDFYIVEGKNIYHYSYGSNRQQLSRDIFDYGMNRGGGDCRYFFAVKENGYWVSDTEFQGYDEYSSYCRNHLSFFIMEDVGLRLSRVTAEDEEKYGKENIETLERFIDTKSIDPVDFVEMLAEALQGKYTYEKG